MPASLALGSFTDFTEAAMSSLELRKQISIFVPLSVWKAIRLEAARRRIPMTELCRRWMQSDLEELQRRPPSPMLTDGE
jgi:hypothetical protein